MMVNHSVEDCDLGKVNGAGQTVAAMARAVGPALGGVIWSVSLQHGVVFANFTATALILVLCEWIAFQLPDSIDLKKGHALPVGHTKDSKSSYSDEESSFVDHGI